MKGPVRSHAVLGVVLVNYRRADDSIECLESLLRSSIPLSVVIVDNGSGDGSLDTIGAWAEGRHRSVPASPDMARFSQPPLTKPLRHVRLSAAEAIASPPQAALTLVDAGDNRGFAAGNNIGIKHLLRDPRIDHVWLLNNDTIVDPNAAAALLARLQAIHDIGMCGTVVRYYWQPGVIQALNGYRFNMLTGNAAGIGAGQPASQPFSPGSIAAQTDFVLGASLAVSRRFIETVGLMAEEYFLYFEEIDWATRNAGRFGTGSAPFVTGFAQGAVVYHKEGGSIGSSGIAGGRSALSDYWLARSRLRFIRRHRPWLLPLHWLLTLGVASRRLLRGQPGKATAVVRALFGLRPNS